MCSRLDISLSWWHDHDQTNDVSLSNWWSRTHDDDHWIDISSVIYLMGDIKLVKQYFSTNFQLFLRFLNDWTDYRLLILFSIDLRRLVILKFVRIMKNLPAFWLNICQELKIQTRSNNLCRKVSCWQDLVQSPSVIKGLARCRIIQHRRVRIGETSCEISKVTTKNVR